MLVQDLMTKPAKTCRGDANLAEAAAVLWSTGCGALPVVDQQLKLIGIVTDRDICMSVGTTNRRPSDVAVSEAMCRDVAFCHPEDDIHCALMMMRARKVRRIPVVTFEGKVAGILSISELLLHARHDDGSRPELSEADILSTLRAIYVHCPPRTICA